MFSEKLSLYLLNFSTGRTDLHLGVDLEREAQDYARVVAIYEAGQPQTGLLKFYYLLIYSIGLILKLLGSPVFVLNS